MPQESEADKEPEQIPESQVGDNDFPGQGGIEATPSQASSSTPEVLGRLPENQRERLFEFFEASMQVSGPMMNPLLNKFESQHITDIIGLSSKTVDAVSSDRKNSRLFGFLGLALLVVAAVVILLVFAIIGENDLLLEIVKLAGVGLGGFGGGYGFSALRNRN